MKRRITFLLFIFPIFFCIASVLTPDQALQRVNGEHTRSLSNPILVKTITSKEGDPSVYIFNNKSDEGYLIVSADDSTIPLLGYSDTNLINIENMPPALTYWLEEYARQIQYLRENNASFFDTRSIQLPEWSSIEPLVTTKWDQDEPYNNLCPVIDGIKVPTGCVATSMAQVMKYFNYPPKGTGSISYSYDLEGKTYQFSKDFSQLSFDWENMVNVYSSNSSALQKNAVATLMEAVGYSVEMQYNPNESGAYTSLIAPALVKYFNYDKGIRYYRRLWYDYSGWSKLLYDNLKNIGPILYDGQGSNGAHSFILDGYQSNGYFHINWGWGGTSDGYYRLDALEPLILGTGGGAGGFNFEQSAVLNIHPDTSESQTETQKIIYIEGILNGNVTDSSLQIYLEDTPYPAVMFQGLDNFMCDFGIKVEDFSAPDSSPLYATSSNFKDMDFEVGSGYYLNQTYPMKIAIGDLGLKNNTQYKVTLVYKTKSGDWTEVFYDNGSSNYFYLTKLRQGLSISYDIETIPVLQFSAENVNLESEFYTDLPIKVSGTIVNKNDCELTRTASVILLTSNFDVAYLGENFLYSLAPGESLTEEWITTLENYEDELFTNETEFYLGLFDYITGYIYYLRSQPVSMKPYPGDPEYSGKIVVDNSATINGIYEVEDSNEFSVTTDITVESGYFFNQSYLYIFQKENNSDLWRSVASFPYPLTDIFKGETKQMTVTVSFPEGEIGETYGLLTYVSLNESLVPITERLETFFIVKGNSGQAWVENINIDSDDMLIYYNTFTKTLIVQGGSSGISSVEVYSLNGERLEAFPYFSNDYLEIDLGNRPKDIIIVKAVDGKGKSKSVKVVL